MSWSALVPATAPDEFDAAVDACTVSPPEEGLAEEPAAQLAEAREVAKTLARELNFDVGAQGIAANLCGHACVEAAKESPEDGISVSVRQAPVAASERLRDG